MKTNSAKFSDKEGNHPGKSKIRCFMILATCLLLANGTKLAAQPGLTIYSDLGRNNASGGLLVKSAAIGCFSMGKNRLEMGSQVASRNRNDQLLSGYLVSLARDLMIRGIPLTLQGFSFRKGNSEILTESNTGLLLKMRHKRFEVKTGTDFRTYTFSKKAVVRNNIKNEDRKIHENFNLMYSVTYYLKLSDEHWNIGISVNNFDCFRINQETNPLVCLHAFLRPFPRLSIYTEGWQETAGLLNLKTNHFGHLLRTGIQWNFN